MITAIAFDFTEVLFTRKPDVELTRQEQKIAESFGFLSPDAVFLAHFVQELGISKEEVEAEVRKLVAKIYQLKEPDLFEKIPRFKFAAATNHLSYMVDYFFTLPFSKHFVAAVSSGELGYEKPEPEFYQCVAARLDEEPKNILFIDDRLENCLGAAACGMRVLHHDPKDLLSEAINQYLGTVEEIK
jgi:FMN phosphatase YigB (HAD superfamily)